jgi:hypothetical protein
MTTAYIFSTALPTDKTGIGTAVKHDLALLSRKYNAIVYVTNASICQVAADPRYSHISFRSFNLNGNHRPTSFYSGQGFFDFLYFYTQCKGDLYFYCWHTPFTDMLRLCRKSNSRKIYLMSHGTFCAPSLIIQNPRLLISLPFDLFYLRFIMPSILDLVDKVGFLSFTPHSDRFSDLRICLDRFPSKIFFNPNHTAIPLKHSCLPLDLDPSTSTASRDKSRLSIIIITRLNRQKGSHLIPALFKTLAKLLEAPIGIQSSYLRIDLHLFAPLYNDLGSLINDKLSRISFNGEYLGVNLHIGLSSIEIFDVISKLESSVAISLSRTECEPFALTEPLSHAIPCVALPAGNLSTLPGIMVVNNVSMMSKVLRAYLFSSNTRIYFAILGQIGRHYLSLRGLVKQHFLS